MIDTRGVTKNDLLMQYQTVAYAGFSKGEAREFGKGDKNQMRIIKIKKRRSSLRFSHFSA